MSNLRHTRAHRRGTYAAVFGVSCFMLLGFTALSIDVGWQRVAMTQLGNAADAGAHAGAMELDGTTAGVAAAKLRAQAIAEANGVAGRSVSIDPLQHLVVGRFDVEGENECTTEGGCWTPMGSVPTGYDVSFSDPVDEETANAMWVGAEEAVPTFFGLFPFGKPSLQAANYAIARLPIVDGGVPCAFPISMPECSMSNWTGSDPCGKLIRMKRTNSNVDNMAWSRVDGSPASTIKEAIATVDGECTNEYAGSDTEDTQLQNGNVSNAQSIIAAQLAGTNNYNVGGVGRFDYGDLITPGWDSTWGACPTGTVSTYCDSTTQGGHCPSALPDCSPTTSARMIKRQITVFDHPGYGCDSDGNITVDDNYNDDVSTTGFVNLIIYDAGSSGGQEYIDGYISCTDEDGLLRDEDEDGMGDVIHQGEGETIEPPEEGTVAIVE